MNMEWTLMESIAWYLGFGICFMLYVWGRY